MSYERFIPQNVNPKFLGPAAPGLKQAGPPRARTFVGYDGRNQPEQGSPVAERQEARSHNRRPNPAHANSHSTRIPSTRHLSRSDRATLASRLPSDPGVTSRHGTASIGDAFNDSANRIARHRVRPERRFLPGLFDQRHRITLRDGLNEARTSLPIWSLATVGLSFDASEFL